MGQAKLRGSREERIVQSVARTEEQNRLKAEEFAARQTERISDIKLGDTIRENKIRTDSKIHPLTLAALLAIASTSMR